MLIITKFAIIIFYSFTFIKNNLKAIMFFGTTVIIAIIFTYAGVFCLSIALNTLDIQSIGSGTGFYSDLLFSSSIAPSAGQLVSSVPAGGIKNYSTSTPTCAQDIKSLTIKRKLNNKKNTEIINYTYKFSLLDRNKFWVYRRENINIIFGFIIKKRERDLDLSVIPKKLISYINYSKNFLDYFYPLSSGG